MLFTTISSHTFRKIASVIAFIVATQLIIGCASARKVRERKIESVISTARSYTGTPYKWGGTTRSGMDCSGLLLNAFRSAKVEIPRTSEEQSKLGSKVKLKKVQKGDLVFFATGKKKRKITHVGMVTDVRGRSKVLFIHSSSSLGVIENDLYSDYYLKRFRKARRVF